VGLKLKTLCEDLIPTLMFFYFHLVESFGAFVSFFGGVGGGRVRGLFLGCWVGWLVWGARAGGACFGDFEALAGSQAACVLVGSSKLLLLGRLFDCLFACLCAFLLTALVRLPACSLRG
jgi:hypothetical protein